MSCHRVTRRTMLRSSAWSVPVVAVTAAAPAYASSSGSTLTLNGPAPTALLDVSIDVVGRRLFVSFEVTAPPPAGTTVDVRFAEAYFRPEQGNLGDEVVPGVVLFGTTGWTTPGDWTATSDGTVRVLRLEAAAGASTVVHLAFEYPNNSVSVRSLTGHVSLMLDPPWGPQSTRVLRP